MAQVFCDWKFVNGPKKGTICNRRINIEGSTKCCVHRKERKTCDWVFVKGPKKGTICNKLAYLDSKTKCYDHCKEKIVITKKSRSQHWDTRLLLGCRLNDKTHNKYFDITEEWINKILNHQNWKCFHCSKYLLLEKGNRDPDQVSVDRVDNLKGHSKGNVVLSCLECNLRRQNTDINIFTPNPKYTILEDNEFSEESDQFGEETEMCKGSSQISNQNCAQM